IIKYDKTSLVKIRGTLAKLDIPQWIKISAKIVFLNFLILFSICTCCTSLLSRLTPSTVVSSSSSSSICCFRNRASSSILRRVLLRHCIERLWASKFLTTIDCILQRKNLETDVLFVDPSSKFIAVPPSLANKMQLPRRSSRPRFSLSVKTT
ncbi:hypothetical protein GQX74_008065, partial [Glossina fuscipes]